MIIYIIRHGETNSNREKRLQGWYDDVLNENGIELASLTGRELKGIHFDEVFTSPLKRARQTACIVLQESGNQNAPIFVDERIKEIYMGKWEHKSLVLPEDGLPKDAKKFFFGNPPLNEAFPDGESLQDVITRTNEFLAELMSRNDEKTYLVSTHGCAMRAMLNPIYDNKEDFWQGSAPANCAVNILHAKDGKTEFIAKDKIYYDPSKTTW